MTEMVINTPASYELVAELFNGAKMWNSPSKARAHIIGGLDMLRALRIIGAVRYCELIDEADRIYGFA